MIINGNSLQKCRLFLLCLKIGGIREMKSIRLLQAANSECTNKEFIIRICECVKDRLGELDMRYTFNPTTANEEKLGDWEEIADVAADIIDKYNRSEIDEELEDMIMDMKDKILDYDLTHQGISRLVI